MSDCLESDVDILGTDADASLVELFTNHHRDQMEVVSSDSAENEAYIYRQLGYSEQQIQVMVNDKQSEIINKDAHGDIKMKIEQESAQNDWNWLDNIIYVLVGYLDFDNKLKVLSFCDIISKFASEVDRSLCKEADQWVYSPETIATFFGLDWRKMMYKNRCPLMIIRFTNRYNETHLKLNEIDEGPNLSLARRNIQTLQAILARPEEFLNGRDFYFFGALERKKLFYRLHIGDAVNGLQKVYTVYPGYLNVRLTGLNRESDYHHCEDNMVCDEDRHEWLPIIAMPDMKAGSDGMCTYEIMNNGNSKIKPLALNMVCFNFFVPHVRFNLIDDSAMSLVFGDIWTQVDSAYEIQELWNECPNLAHKEFWLSLGIEDTWRDYEFDFHFIEINYGSVKEDQESRRRNYDSYRRKLDDPSGLPLTPIIITEELLDFAQLLYQEENQSAKETAKMRENQYENSFQYTRLIEKKFESQFAQYEQQEDARRALDEDYDNEAELTRLQTLQIEIYEDGPDLEHKTLQELKEEITIKPEILTFMDRCRAFNARECDNDDDDDDVEQNNDDDED